MSRHRRHQHRDARHRPTKEYTSQRVTSRTEAISVARRDNDTIALVDRHGVRAAYFACPCGCRDIVVLNLDPGTGPAWILFDEGDGVSIIPSVVRESGCRSHFILWKGGVLWCKTFRSDIDPDWPAALRRALENWDLN